MKNQKRINLLLLLKIMLGFSFLLYAGTSAAQWVTPSEYKGMKNIKANDKDADLVGKTLYSKHCKSCHGAKGDGQGPKAKGLDTDINSFNSSGFKALKDGDIYYRAFIGRDEMPNFEKKITDKADRWLLVNYLRTFK